MLQKVKINGQEYEVIDAKERMTVADSWVLKNKIGGGHGEAKFYLGNSHYARNLKENNMNLNIRR